MIARPNYRLTVFPPWFVHNNLLGEVRQNLSFREYFLLIWMTCQWLLIFSSGKNLIVGLFCANLSIAGFLYSNLYIQLDVRQYSPQDQEFLRCIPLRIVIGLGTLFALYLIASLPKLIAVGLEGYYRKYPISSSFVWTGYHSMIGYALALLWVLYMLFFESETFQVLRRTAEKIWPAQLTIYNRALIILFYIAIVVNFMELYRLGHIVYFR